MFFCFNLLLPKFIFIVQCFSSRENENIYGNFMPYKEGIKIHNFIIIIVHCTLLYIKLCKGNHKKVHNTYKIYMTRASPLKFRDGINRSKINFFTGFSTLLMKGYTYKGCMMKGVKVK